MKHLKNVCFFRVLSGDHDPCIACDGGFSRCLLARLNAIRDMLSRLPYDGKDESLILSNPNLIFPHEEDYFHNEMIVP